MAPPIVSPPRRRPAIAAPEKDSPPALAVASAPEPGEGIAAGPAVRVLLSLIIFLMALIATLLVGQHAMQRPAAPRARPAAPSSRSLAEWTDRLTRRDDPQMRRQAAHAVVELGTDALIVVLDEITEIAADGRTYALDQSAVAALAGEGRSAVDLLRECLYSKDREVRLGAISVLREIGPDAEVASPELQEALEDEDLWVRQLAAETLAKVRSGAVPKPAE
jgi:HEAT repeat protein